MGHRLPDNLDALVIGAGTAGCTAARAVAASGARVAIVERSSEEDVGRKACGNAVTGDGLVSMARHMVVPRAEEIAGRITAATVEVADGGPPVSVCGAAVVLNRLVFGQRLLGDAIAAGAEFFQDCTCLGWSDRDDARIRLRWRDGDDENVGARVVIDASGYRSVLTRHGGPFYSADQPARTEVGIAYREIVPLMESLADPDRGAIVIAPEGARDGYGWILPMGDRLANVGLGASLPCAGTGLRGSYARFLGAHPELKATDPIAAGAGLVPLRRPLASLVGDRFMTVGDAGCQANPLSGGGIAPSVVAGALAGEQAVIALASGDLSTKGLWPYNARFMRGIGAVHAAHEALRRVLFTLGERDLRFLTLRLARSDSTMRLLGAGGARPRLAVALHILAATVRRPALVPTLVRGSRLIDAMYRLYTDYPESHTRFGSWLGQQEYQMRALVRATAGGGEP
jgi:geranylgeranyl reductase family protein